MDDMAAYYPPPSAHPPPPFPYYQPHPPPLGPPAPPPQQVAPPPPPPPPQQQPFLFPHQPPPPPFASYAPPLYPQTSVDEVRTLFIAGLPEDVKPREIYNLFREFPGYESSHLRSPSQNSQPFAFAVFLDQQSAIAAMHALNGMVFDLEKGSTLYIDLAKSNSRSKRSRADDERPGLDKKVKGSAGFSRPPDSAGVGSVHMPGMGNSAYSMIGYPSTQSHGNFDGRALNETPAKLNNSSAPYFPQNATPCPTLFVANLGPTCSEQELIDIFSRCPGFLKLKMQSTYGTPVAFVDFQDTPCSTGALNHLQGTVLYSSPAGEGMRIEYAKSRMGLRRKPK
ncbi:RNA-binding protein L isoform X3 [Vitis vinifera]|uniref:RNA-binding protein L isoform X3 n=1 Tax=Vitis vinifera TaxID=29760 RepID=UPI00053F5672|nr:RNA-binding protein L isoform X3 [Vitis vinifera]|eukprot:XP_010652787.1 PREDICTED: U1 small nuclear ribonucleoprotein A isoform X1 [Vitis vinifera]